MRCIQVPGGATTVKNFFANSQAGIYYSRTWLSAAVLWSDADFRRLEHSNTAAAIQEMPFRILKQMLCEVVGPQYQLQQLQQLVTILAGPDWFPPHQPHSLSAQDSGLLCQVTLAVIRQQSLS